MHLKSVQITTYFCYAW